MDKEEKFINLLGKISKLPITKFIVTPISWVFSPFFFLALRNPEFKSMYTLMKIEKLESRDKISEARELRNRVLKNRRVAKFPELWVSKGKDLLYRKNMYSHALLAFNKAIKINPDYNPIQMYYGAACSAICCGQYKLAQIYHEKFNNWWDKYMRDPRLHGYYFTNYLGCKNWLDKKMKSF